MKTKIILLIVLLTALPLGAKSLDEKIANMFIVGFYGTTATANSTIMSDICDMGLGGVILFDRHPSQKGKAKNISSVSQLKKLNYSLLHGCMHQPLISIDEEGGKVQRLRSKNGFYGHYPSAKFLSKRGVQGAQKIYAQMAKEMSSVNINFNLGPIADVAVNPKNKVINGFGRSYGRDPKRVAIYDRVFMAQMHRYGILTSLKHFPGHGSSLGDTHDGFVDITNTWQKQRELEPYRRLILAGKVDSIMVAHVFNRRLDKKYPASLSKKVVTGVLRTELGYRGVVISDDMQMGAISKHYDLENSIRLSINAGVDMLLFGNQLDPSNEVGLPELVGTTRKLIKEGKIKVERINEANIRIDRMKSKIGLGL